MLCLRLCPSLCKFHCRACSSCVREMGCCRGLVILFPFFAAVVGLVAGLGIAAEIFFPTGYYKHYGWHDAHGQVLPFTVLATVVCALLLYFHPRPLYCIRVERNPSLRVKCPCCCRKTRHRERNRNSCRCGQCECLPLLTFLLGANLGLWSIWFFTIAPWLVFFPGSVAAGFCGAMSKLNGNRLCRLLRICCGRTTYEIIEDFNPLSTVDPEDDEIAEDWLETSASDTSQSGEEDADDLSTTDSDASFSDSEASDGEIKAKELNGSERLRPRRQTSGIYGKVKSQRRATRAPRRKRRLKGAHRV